MTCKRPFALVICLLLILAIVPVAAAAPPITNHDIIYNGQFDRGVAGWGTIGFDTTLATAANYGNNGTAGLKVTTVIASDGFFFQQLHLPTTTTDLSLAYDIRIVGRDPQPGGAAMYAALETETTRLAITQFANNLFNDSGWNSLTWNPTAGEIAAVQAQHAAGNAVYLSFYLQQFDEQGQPSADEVELYVDNVVVTVTGERDQPATSAEIAFVGFNAQNDPQTIRTIRPDGQQAQTIWTHPSSIQPRIYDLAWRPDGGEIAFSSNHEAAYSAFSSDVYGISPTGGGLRRITNPPSHADVINGNDPTGTVTGQIYNNYGNVTLFNLYVEGAVTTQIVSLGAYDTNTPFTIPNVAVVDDGLSYIVFNWSNNSCANGKEYAALAVPVIANQTVDIGTITFNGYCNSYDNSSVTWKRDGSEIATNLLGARRFMASGEAIGRDLLSNLSESTALRWSPTNDQLVYYRTIGDNGFYQATAGGDAGTRIIPQFTTFNDAAWLPDGSGFIYTTDNTINLYTPARGTTLLATFQNETVGSPSLSADGNYIVFERRTAGSDYHDLWLMRRSNPNEMWALTSDGKSGNPTWRTTSQTPTTITLAQMASQHPSDNLLLPFITLLVLTGAMIHANSIRIAN